MYAGGSQAYPVPRVAVDPSESWINLVLYILSWDKTEASKRSPKCHFHQHSIIFIYKIYLQDSTAGKNQLSITDCSFAVEVYQTKKECRHSISQCSNLSFALNLKWWSRPRQKNCFETILTFGLLPESFSSVLCNFCNEFYWFTKLYFRPGTAEK